MDNKPKYCLYQIEDGLMGQVSKTHIVSWIFLNSIHKGCAGHPRFKRAHQLALSVRRKLHYFLRSPEKIELDQTTLAELNFNSIDKPKSTI